MDRKTKNAVGIMLVLWGIVWAAFFVIFMKDESWASMTPITGALIYLLVAIVVINVYNVIPISEEETKNAGWWMIVLWGAAVAATFVILTNEHWNIMSIYVWALGYITSSILLIYAIR